METMTERTKKFTSRNSTIYCLATPKLHLKLALVLQFAFFEVSAFAVRDSKIVKGDKPATNRMTVYCEKMKKWSKNRNHKLNQLLEIDFQNNLEESPEFATFAGKPGFNDKWTDWSDSAIERRRSDLICLREALNGSAKEKWTEADELNFKLFKKKTDTSVEGLFFQDELLRINQMDGIQVDVVDVLKDSPGATKKDIEDRFTRLKSFSRLVDETISLMERGLKLGISNPKVLMLKVPKQIDSVLEGSLEDGPLYSVFKESSFVTASPKNVWVLNEAKTIIQENVYPSLKKLKKFLVEEYIPNCRTSTSWKDLPNGEAWYNFLARYHTTTSMSALDIHQLGLREVERLENAMKSLRESIPGVSAGANREDFHRFLLNDPQFFYSTSKDLLTNYRDIAKRIDPELPKLFKTLPRLTYGVREISPHKAEAAPTAYYHEGSAEAGYPGYFEANTFDLKSRPKWEMEVLTLHEAVPGHHLQLALQSEMTDIPEFRKYISYTSFIEGWGLYAESLGSDLGLFRDVYSKYGYFAYEMWRSVRLVVDTGMHALGWTREQGLTYFMDHIPKTKLQAENEIDRYLVNPGQALAYKVGQLKFLELRERVKAKLKDKFDIRLFHDEILKRGALPMDLLETYVDKKF